MRVAKAIELKPETERELRSLAKGRRVGARLQQRARIVLLAAEGMHPDVQAWLARHPRFVMHFAPTSASWLNIVERFFRIDPKPFIWTASACDILAKVTRAKAARASVR